LTSGPRIYDLFWPLVGDVAAWETHLDRIAAMRFDWIYLNPFHAVGFSGSLYAVKAYDRLHDRALGGRDPAEGDALLRGFCAAARTRGIAVMMDLVANHTARDADLVAERPSWYLRDETGAVVSPHAVDPDDPSKKTVWGDLAELDYRPRPERAELIAYFAEVVRRYVRLGFAGFRCDAAYKIPGDAWSELIAAARAIDPDVLFAAETLGCTPAEVRALAPAGFAYLFNSSKWWDFRGAWLYEQYDAFRAIAPSIAFPESHDTPRLASEFADRPPETVERAYRFRYLFAAFFSAGVMLPIGYEFGFRRALDVVGGSPEAWEEPQFDLSTFVRDVNALKATTPVLGEEGPAHVVPLGEAVLLVRRRTSGPGVAIALANAMPDRSCEVGAAELRAALAEYGDLVERTPDAAALDRTSDAPAVLAPLMFRIFVDAAVPSVPPGRLQAEDDGRATAPSVVIEGIRPQIDGGRHPVKRVVGEPLVVEADIFREGHDLLAAELLHRECGARSWSRTPFAFLENDRWSASFTPTRNARYEYAIEAWPDDFATWRHDFTIKRDAGADVGLELREGLAVLTRALQLASTAGGAAADVAALEARAHRIATAPDDAARAAWLDADATAELLARVAPRERPTRYPVVFEAIVDRRAARDGAWYEVFPRSEGAPETPSGTFADVERRIPAIRAMGFDVLYFPPIHPIGRAFRKGKNNSLTPSASDPGSPYAIGGEAGGHREIEPSLGDFAAFDRLVATAARHGMEIALDYALQCSPDHPYVRDHPEWFTVRPDGTIKYAENPPKKYQDIVNFNFFGPHAPALWDELRDVVLFWAARDVRIFRVDNPHTKPFAFWEWMIREVQTVHPDTVFLAEAFTRPKVMKELAKVGFSQSYTYFTWRTTKDEITEYLSELTRDECAEYYRPNFFANTPDILPFFLQNSGRPGFVIRLVLAATLSSAYGIYSGYEICEAAALPGREEYLDSEKYEIRRRAYDAPGNIVAEITEINRIRRENPALLQLRNLTFLPSSDPHVIAYVKIAGENAVLVCVNLDPFASHVSRIEIPRAALGYDDDAMLEATELFGGVSAKRTGPTMTVTLDPRRNPAALWRIRARPARNDRPAVVAVHVGS